MFIPLLSRSASSVVLAPICTCVRIETQTQTPCPDCGAPPRATRPAFPFQPISSGSESTCGTPLHSASNAPPPLTPDNKCPRSYLLEFVPNVDAAVHKQLGRRARRGRGGRLCGSSGQSAADRRHHHCRCCRGGRCQLLCGRRVHARPSAYAPPRSLFGVRAGLGRSARPSRSLTHSRRTLCLPLTRFGRGTHSHTRMTYETNACRARGASQHAWRQGPLRRNAGPPAVRSRSQFALAAVTCTPTPLHAPHSRRRVCVCMCSPVVVVAAAA